MSLPRIASRVFNTPLMIQSTKLDAILHGLGTRLGIDYPEQPDAFISARTSRNPGGFRTTGNIGIIDVFGVLVHRGGGMTADSDYVQGYDGIASQLDAAVKDPNVKHIVLNIDSPGGEVAGVFQLADKIHQASLIKPITAMVDTFAASAAYLIASAASSISMDQGGIAGSIGVLFKHADLSNALAMEGVKITHIYAGSHKVDGNPYEPLSQDTINSVQDSVNKVYNKFVNTVSSYRAKYGLSVDMIKSTEADTFDAERSIQLRLADRIESADHLISRLQDEVKMDEINKALDTLKAENADLLAKVQASTELIGQLNAKIATLNDKIADESSRADTVTATANELIGKLKAIHDAERKESIKALFGNLGLTVSEDKEKAYMAMSDETFSMIVNDFTTTKPNLPDSFFKDTATSGATQSSEIELSTKLYNQVAGVK